MGKRLALERLRSVSATRLCGSATQPNRLLPEKIEEPTTARTDGVQTGGPSAYLRTFDGGGPADRLAETAEDWTLVGLRRPLRPRPWFGRRSGPRLPERVGRVVGAVAVVSAARPVHDSPAKIAV